MLSVQMLVSSLSKVTLFDVYKGEHVPKDSTISVLIMFVNRNATLEEDVIKSAMTRVKKH